MNTLPTVVRPDDKSVPSPQQSHPTLAVERRDLHSSSIQHEVEATYNAIQKIKHIEAKEIELAQEKLRLNSVVTSSSGQSVVRTAMLEPKNVKRRRSNFVQASGNDERSIKRNSIYACESGPSKQTPTSADDGKPVESNINLVVASSTVVVHSSRSTYAAFDPTKEIIENGYIYTIAPITGLRRRAMTTCGSNREQDILIGQSNTVTGNAMKAKKEAQTRRLTAAHRMRPVIPIRVVHRTMMIPANHPTKTILG